MKSRNQSGSAHLIIIIALVVVVLGALGVIFWQNFVNKPTATVENTNTSSQSQKESGGKDSVGGSKTVSITEWGVKGNYSGDEDYVYSMKGTYSVPNIWTLTRSSLSISCADLPGSVSRGIASEDAVVGSTSSGKTNQEAYDLGYGLARAHVGDYYYFYSGPQADCMDISDTSRRAKLVTAMTEVVESLESE